MYTNYIATISINYTTVVRYLFLHPYRSSGKLVHSYEYKVSHSANYMPCYCVDKSSSKFERPPNLILLAM